MFKKIEKNGFCYGFPVILMTTHHSETGNDCLTPISSSWTLDQTVVLGIGCHNQGYTNLDLGSPLTLNIADYKLWENVERIAKTTGKQVLPAFKADHYQYCEDKFTLGNFTKLLGKTVKTARISECPLQIETEVVAISERAGFAIVECAIKGIFVDEAILYNDTQIDVQKWQPLIYKFRSYTTTQQTLGNNFRFQEN